jgi:N-acylglucosamine 2-epimerase
MEPVTRKQLAGFYENELTNNILWFWLPRCIDREYGGYFNCFTNDGSKLVSKDKYTWSQGRFVWTFSRLATIDAPVFTRAQRAEFLKMARIGKEFLEKHCLMGPDDWRCIFLMDQQGRAKEVAPGQPLDMSIYADAFVILGMARYAIAAGDKNAYIFAKKLLDSCFKRIDSGEFRTLPYPLSDRFRAHGIPMIFCDTTRETALAAEIFDPDALPELKKRLEDFTVDILTNFTDENNLIHEVIGSDNRQIPQILGQHINPGHSLEDVWFILNSACYLEKPQWAQKARAIARETLKIGWDEKFGGLLHFCGMSGGKPEGDETGVEDEPMLIQMKDGWSDKLWWVHSEALYTTLRCYLETGDEYFWHWHQKIFAYTFTYFPNPDREVREWVQILKRDGTPQDKVVALPVKDPYHIIRNLLLILEILHAPKEL